MVLHLCKITLDNMQADLYLTCTNENSGPFVFLGGLLLLITSILEFILGNTFPCVVFGTIGKSSNIMLGLAMPCSLL